MLLRSLLATALLAPYGFSETPAPPPWDEDPQATAPAKMDNARIGELIKRIDPEATGDAGTWRFTVGGETVLCITSEPANRMRLLCSVAPVDELTPDKVIASLQANYHTALDGRYCIGEDALLAAFLHPLGDLSQELFLSAVAQVVSLKKTFGTTYTGGTFQFGLPGAPAGETPPGGAGGDVI